MSLDLCINNKKHLYIFFSLCYIFMTSLESTAMREYFPHLCFCIQILTEKLESFVNFVSIKLDKKHRSVWGRLVANKWCHKNKTNELQAYIQPG